MVNISHECFDRFVEGVFDGIRSDYEDKKLYLFLRESNGKKWTLMIEEAYEHIACTIIEMYTMNIIDRITIFDKSNDEEEYIDKLSFLYYGCHVEKDKRDKRDWSFIPKYTKKIKHGDMFILELEPVAGATVLVLAEKLCLIEG